MQVGPAQVIVAEVQGDAQSLMQTLDSLRSKFDDAIVVLAHVANDKVSLVVGISKSLTSQVTAPELINMAATEINNNIDNTTPKENTAK